MNVCADRNNVDCSGNIGILHDTWFVGQVETIQEKRRSSSRYCRVQGITRKENDRLMCLLVAAVSSGSSKIPSLFDDEFDEWSKAPGNLEKWENSLDNLEGL